MHTMNENSLLVIEILRDTLRQIEENSDAENNDPIVDRLKNEFQRMICHLELSGGNESARGASGSHQSAFIP